MAIATALLFTTAPLVAAPTALDAAASAQTRLIQALRRSGTVANDLPLAHVAYICALKIDGRLLHVIDIVQMVPKASATGGARRIALITPAGQVRRRIDYARQRPLECRGDRLILDGLLDPDADGRTGNVITFRASGATGAVADIASAELWPPAETR